MYRDPRQHTRKPAPTIPSSQDFRSFPSLPAEIRTMIWEYSLPEARVYEIMDAPDAKQKTPAQKGLMFANVHQEPPPALASVCRESRYYVLRHYKPLKLGNTTKFVDLARDMLLLEPYLLIKRLHRTLHFMGQIPLLRDGVTRLALGTSYGVYTGICHPVLSWKVSKNNMGKLLAGLAQFSKLKALVFIVHQEFQFEFDFRYPPALSLPALAASAGLGGSSSLSLSAPVPPTSSAPPTSAPLPSLPPLLPPPSGPVSASPSLTPRPQVVHQAYRFKFDIEANINYHPRRPQLNELLYYPLDIDDSKDDDWHAVELELGLDGGRDDDDASEWCDPWPTNDDWRRFKRHFQRATLTALDMGLAEGWSRGTLPSVKGASLLWRYTRGEGYAERSERTLKLCEA